MFALHRDLGQKGSVSKFVLARKSNDCLKGTYQLSFSSLHFTNMLPALANFWHSIRMAYISIVMRTVSSIIVYLTDDPLMTEIINVI